MTQIYRVFALDLDGVVYDFPSGLLQYLRDRWGIRKSLEQWTDLNLARLTEDDTVNRDVIEKIQDPFWYDEFIHPYPQAEEALHRLKAWGDLCFITSRPPGALREVTRRRLSADFGSDIFNESTLFSMSKNRPRAARTFHATYAFEDNPTVAKEYTKHRIVCYVIDQPYNQDRYIQNWWMRPAGNLLEAAKAFERSMQSVEV